MSQYDSVKALKKHTFVSTQPDCLLFSNVRSLRNVSSFYNTYKSLNVFNLCLNVLHIDFP